MTLVWMRLTCPSPTARQWSSVVISTITAVLSRKHYQVTTKLNDTSLDATDLSFSNCRSVILCFSSSSSLSASLSLILSTSSCISFTLNVSCRSDSLDRRSRQICSLVDSWRLCASSFRWRLLTSACTNLLIYFTSAFTAIPSSQLTTGCSLRVW